MRGLRTWASVFCNWTMISVLLIFGHFGYIFHVAGMFVIFGSLAIISSDMKWWKADTENLDAAFRMLENTGQQLATYRKIVKGMTENPTEEK